LFDEQRVHAQRMLPVMRAGCEKEKISHRKRAIRARAFDILRDIRRNPQESPEGVDYAAYNSGDSLADPRMRRSRVVA